MEYFSRNASCKDWDQEMIARQTALVLGMGGLGAPLCITLCRLGVGRIIILDNDRVEASNLNRQILYTREEIGEYKVDAAKRNLERHHCVQTEIVSHNIDALSNWETVVSIVRDDATCVFNTIDHGDYFDFAIASLAKVSNVPLVCGGTDPVYGSLFSVNISKSCRHETCWGCIHHLPNQSLQKQLSPVHITALKTIEFVPADTRDDSKGSLAFAACACAQFMAALMVEYIMPRTSSSVPDKVICPLLSFDVTKFHCDVDPSCIIHKNLTMS